MKIQAVKFRKDGFMNQPFAFGGEEGVEKFDPSVKYRSGLQNYVIDTGDEAHGIKVGTAFEDLPIDWRCPRCKQTKEKFNAGFDIYADFEKGHSFLNLSIKYGLASATIRDIVKRERKLKKSIRSKETAVIESDDETIVALRQTIGVNSTLAIIEKLGGRQIYLPQENTIIREERESCIYNDFNNGLSFREIAVRYSVSEAQARYIVKKRMKKCKNKRDKP